MNDRKSKSKVWIPRVAILILVATAALYAASRQFITYEIKATPFDAKLPVGLPELEIPADNPMTEEKVALGKRLFFDKNLSLDRTISCASCHDREKGWSNGERFAKGVHGAVGDRNTPTILNAAFNMTQFWDGRAKSLEEQSLGPILNPIEMAMPSKEALVKRIKEDKEYRRLFGESFEDGITAENVGKAIATFERTIISGDTAYDRFAAGDETAMSESAQRGLKLFRNQRKGNCGECHGGQLFTDHKFYNTGVGFDQPNPDLGRQKVTKSIGHNGAFKSPSLREIASTPPYMHDGSLATLKDVVEFYNKGGIPNDQLNIGVKPLRLKEQEVEDIVQFMIEGLSTYKGTVPK